MGRIFLIAILMTVIGIPQLSFAQPSLSSEIAPTGKLRVAMNGGNPVLLRRASDGKMVGGVAFEVGKFVADKLGITFELVAYANADTYTQSFGKGEWDIGFGTPAPLVVDKADFVMDLVLADFAFVAAPNRQFTDATASRSAGSQDRCRAKFFLRSVPQPQFEIGGAGALASGHRRHRGVKQRQSGCLGHKRHPGARDCQWGSRRQGRPRSVHERALHVDAAERTLLCGSGQDYRDRQ